MPPTGSNPALDRFVDRVSKLYTLPAVAVQVLQLTAHPRVDAHAMKDCLEKDPALTSKVLRVVNSSLFGLTSKVSDLNQALALLGIKPLKLLVLGFSLPDKLFVGMAGDILHRYWRRSLTKAVAARELSQTVWNLPGDEAFLAGLLQDLGVLVLLQELGEPYVKLLDLAYAKAPAVTPFEGKSLGFDHVQLSARLLERWGLPASLIGALSSAQRGEALADLPLAERSIPQILHLAELLASLLTENRADLLPELLDAGSKFHHLTHAQLSALVGSLQEKVEVLADVLAVELLDDADYAHVLAEAHAQLAALASDAAGELLRTGRTDDSASDSESILAEVQALVSAVRGAAQATQSAPTGMRLPAAAGDAAADDAASVSTARRPEALATHAETTEPLAGSHAPRRAGTRHGAGSEVDPAFLGLLTSMAATCRQSRCPLSVVLLEIDHFDNLTLTRGPEGAQRIVRLLGTMCRNAGPADLICRQTRDEQFALVLPGCDRQAAVEVGQQLLREVRHVGSVSAAEGRTTVSVSVGVAAVALAPKNFSPELLIDSAQRCLSAARLSGGNALKSIEL